VLIPALILVTWWLGTDLNWFSARIVSTPGQVFDAFRSLVASGQLATYVAASGRRMAIGFAFGFGFGFLLGLLSGLSLLGEELIDPTMQAVRAVPFLALIPILISWVGVGELAKYLVIAFAAAIPMYIYTYSGVRNVDRKVVEAARGFGLRGWGLATKVIIPSAAPALLTALRVTLSVSLLGLIVAEQINTTAGIGYLVVLAQTYFAVNYMVLCIILYAGIGIAIDLFVRVLERVLMPWRKQVTLR
jgi:sulfonate transport system permease protein